MGGSAPSLGEIFTYMNPVTMPFAVAKDLGINVLGEAEKAVGDIAGQVLPDAPKPPEVAPPPSPEQLASEEEARKKKAKLEEEQRLITEYPGRGGVIQNQAPTFRFM